MVAHVERVDARSPPQEVSRGDGIATLTARPRLATDAPPQAQDIAIDDWEVLCAAIETRLGLIVNAQVLEPSAATADGALRGIRTDVLDCVQALAQLRSALAHERVRGRAVERALSQAQASVAHLRNELAGTRAAERRARHGALHDSLTALPNRAYFFARLEQAIVEGALRGPSVAVMYIDLDGFKRVNDTHGHATGDEMLRIVAARLTRAMRAEDVVCRLGGDEFAALLSVVPPCAGRLACLARELSGIVAAPFQIGTLSLTVRPSIGIAVWPDDGATVELLLRHADTAMYRAKRARSGHAFFDGHDDAVVGQPESASTPVSPAWPALRHLRSHDDLG
jgi:diguanylate cyclase (GGDEF)-like protein